MTEHHPEFALRVKDLAKSFGNLLVIDSLSFEMKKGDRLLIMGASGIGKTTLFRILAGLLEPDSGSSEYGVGIRPAILFQEPRLFPQLNLIENINLPLQARGNAQSSEDEAKLQNWLSLLNLSQFTKAYPHELSGGMKRKVSLLRAIITKPNFLLLDEPFQSLDQDSKEIFIHQVLPELEDLSILFTTHEVMEIPMLATGGLYFKESYLTAPIRLDLSIFENIFTNQV